MSLPTPKEPIWNLVHFALISQLEGIVQANDGNYWTTLRAVYGFRPAEWDPSKLPACAIYPVPETNRREYQDGSRTVKESIQYFMDFEMNKTGPSTQPPQIIQARLIADVHRAIYKNPNLGVLGVKRVTFPVGPKFGIGYVMNESKTLSFKYLCEVALAYLDDAP